MSAFKSLAAAAIFSLTGAPSMAQQVISEPGYCAQFYPSANCQNKGPGNPYTGDYQRSLAYQGMGVYPGGQSAVVVAPRPRAHRSKAQ